MTTLGVLVRVLAVPGSLPWKQEYLAEFVDWSGDAFFRIEDLLVDGKPIDIPKRADGVFCTIDTATKTGKENDATAVIYWAWNKIGDNYPLIILDWDITQIEGAHLEIWLPNVLDTCEDFARPCGRIPENIGQGL